MLYVSYSLHGYFGANRLCEIGQVADGYTHCLRNDNCDDNDVDDHDKKNVQARYYPMWTQNTQIDFKSKVKFKKNLNDQMGSRNKKQLMDAAANGGCGECRKSNFKPVKCVRRLGK